MFDSLQPCGLQSPRLLSSWNSLGKNIGVGTHSLLQGIFPTQGLNSGLKHYRQILYCLSHQGSPLVNNKWSVNIRLFEKNCHCQLSEMNTCCVSGSVVKWFRVKVCKPARGPILSKEFVCWHDSQAKNLYMFKAKLHNGHLLYLEKLKRLTI